jgi:hypothetical protein
MGDGGAASSAVCTDDEIRMLVDFVESEGPAWDTVSKLLRGRFSAKVGIRIDAK